jgi:predicted hydrocarbon binding protein
MKVAKGGYDMRINRKEFFSRVWRWMIGTWAVFSFGGPGLVFFTAKKDGEEDQMAQKSKFVHDWISNLMKNMDRQMDDEGKTRLLEECGRACAERHAKAEALKHKGNLDGWLGVFKKWVGSDNVRREDNAVHLIYSKCLCPLVQNHPPLMSKTYCNCSRGWLKEVFETVVEKPVEVKLENSIMQGAEQCRFTVLI